MFAENMFVGKFVVVVIAGLIEEFPERYLLFSVDFGTILLRCLLKL